MVAVSRKGWIMASWYWYGLRWPYGLRDGKDGE